MAKNSSRMPPGFEQKTLAHREKTSAKYTAAEVGRVSKITRAKKPPAPPPDRGNPFAGLTPAQAAEAMKRAFLSNVQTDLHARSGHPLLSERMAADAAARRDARAKPKCKK